MAPKRKRGKKRRKGKRKKVKGGLTNVERELYEITIKTLTERLQRREELIEELTNLRNQYQSQYDQLMVDRNDIIECLKREVEEKIKDIEELRNDIIQIEHLRQMDREKAQEETRAIKLQLTNAANELQQENELLHQNLASLEGFRIKKEEIEAYVANLENKLEEKTKQYERELIALEKLGIIDLERLRNEMTHKVEEAAEACRQFSQNHISETVKRAIKERIRMGVELKRIGDTAFKLSEENEELKTKENNMKNELKTSHDCEAKMSFGYQSQCDMVKQLKRVCAKHKKDQEIIDSLREENAELVNTAKTQAKCLQSQEINATYLTNEIRALTQKNFINESEIERQSKLINGLLAVIQECARCIKQGINEYPQDEEEQVQYLGKRQTMMCQLVEIMERAAEMGNTDYCALILSQRETSVAREWIVDQPPLQYQEGDLGILPKYEPINSKRRNSVKSTTSFVIDRKSLKSLPQIRKVKLMSELQPRSKTLLSQMGLLVKFERVDKMIQELRC